MSKTFAVLPKTIEVMTIGRANQLQNEISNITSMVLQLAYQENVEDKIQQLEGRRSDLKTELNEVVRQMERLWQ
jgi:chromosome condensin MukBEF ATPase and DNA-binding subunit MukB